MITYKHNTNIETVLANMVEVNFVDGPEDGFRKVKETLERMGVPSRKENAIYQSAHIFHKRGRYYICHFKELFAADGKSAELSDDDISRRNLIVKYLVDWELIKPITENWLSPVAHPRQLKVIKYGEKDKWELRNKYQIGVRKD